MSSLSNMQNVTTCGGNSPVSVSYSSLTSAQSPDGNSAIGMSVTYTTPTMIPIPGLLAKNCGLSVAMAAEGEAVVITAK